MTEKGSPGSPRRWHTAGQLFPDPAAAEQPTEIFSGRAMCKATNTGLPRSSSRWNGRRQGPLEDLQVVSAHTIGRIRPISVSSGPYRSATVRSPSQSARLAARGWEDLTGAPPGESHATNGRFPRPGRRHRHPQKTTPLVRKPAPAGPNFFRFRFLRCRVVAVRRFLRRLAQSKCDCKVGRDECLGL
jgi:hypothetical protein